MVYLHNFSAVLFWLLKLAFLLNLLLNCIHIFHQSTGFLETFSSMIFRIIFDQNLWTLNIHVVLKKRQRKREENEKEKKKKRKKKIHNNENKMFFFLKIHELFDKILKRLGLLFFIPHHFPWLSPACQQCPWIWVSENMVPASTHA